VNACDPEFRRLVQTALVTGARYSELCRMEVADFNPDAGTVRVGRSKPGKSREIILNDEGVAFFSQQCLGRAGHEVIFQHACQRGDEGGPWRTSEQGPLMKQVCERAKLTPRITFHGLRHTWASLAVMNGVPLMVVAQNFGHRDTTMVEHHYGHLAPASCAMRSGSVLFDRRVHSD
jgi:integrase